jgi:transcriptional regulator with XRE-family HTH domain
MPVRVSGPKFRYELARRGLSQRELARLAHVDKNTISHAAAGRSLQQPVLRKIAAALQACPVLDVDLVAP